MCGIIGIASTEPVAGDIYNGLLMLQHRGQDSAGIVSYNGHFHIKKGNGLVSEVFKQEDVSHLKGNMGIGHVRYRTSGSLDPDAAQPFMVTYPYGINLIHNGNLTNYKQLRERVLKENRRYLNSNSDTELILATLASELKRIKAVKLSPDEIFDGVKRTMKLLKGAYAIIAFIAGHGLLAFRDPYAIRPLIYGVRKRNGKKEYMVASESVALDSQGFEVVNDVQPGEAILIDLENKLHTFQCIEPKAKRPCIFEFVYLARPDSMIDDLSIYKTRLRMGEKLSKKIAKADLDIDSIIPVPDTARSTALAIANKLNITYREGFIKNRYVGRTFIMPGQEERQKSIKRKLNPIKLEFRNKNVLLVDDSIVRGNTSRKIIKLAREAGAKKVYFASAAPPIINPDVYGVDIPTRNELIAHNRTIEEIRKEIGADELFYQDVEDLIESASEGSTKTNEFHTGCFDGGYPTPEVTEELLQKMEEQNLSRDESEKHHGSEQKITGS